MKTIGQILELFDIPISTLRYYDKEGLFPNIKRKSGIRSFTSTEVEALHVIDCIKKSGMEIKVIKYGYEEDLIAMLPDALPKEIQVLFDKGHGL